MSPQEIEQFHRDGVLRLPGFHARARLAQSAARLRDEAQRRLATASFARALRKLPVFQQITRLSGALTAGELDRVLLTPELTARVGELAGRAPLGGQGAQVLASPPRQGAWTLDGLGWHVDLAADPQQQRVPGIQAFFLVDDVAPRGGATLALAGSHRATPGDLRAALRARDAGLEARLAALGVRVVEMCGRAGDTYLMDMRVLHAPAVNATPNLRLMATCRCLFAD
ncbi:MAG: phytanoyl-CoA dioxygenase family protein [Myxococcales bacterium]|nr:phytanoyl-CoA dioxygenase family protein [Myxococcales bacterium]MCB9737041.1 phytanoyl-CoA dioxygenase family protein [Deltaproteobacteria bacterium]